MAVIQSDDRSPSAAAAAPRSGSLSAPEPGPPRGPRRWPLVLLGLSLVWSALLRVPLILNATEHLDSDLAVDGLTLREAMAGHWRWHYPGTPYIGIVPVLYSWPQAAVWGVGPSTLVSGGTVAYLALVAATFALAWRVFGRSAALWGLVPLTFASTGVLWLSSRITGGHLTAAVWHAGAFLGLYASLVRGGSWRPFVLGLWCGFGLYLDTMFLLTLAGLIPVAVVFWWRSGRSRSGVAAAFLFAFGMLVGSAPREIGEKTDPYNAYGSQFEPIFEPKAVLNHVMILGRDCLPRLVAGHRLPDLQADPDPGSLGGSGPGRGPREATPLAITVTVLILVFFLAAVRALADPQTTRGDPAAAAVRWGLMVSAIVNLAAFLVHRHIYNSDNYRYIVDLVVPWSVGFGLSMCAIGRLGRPGVMIAGLCSLALASLMTLDAVRWYQRYGWIDARGLPVRKAVNDPALAWLNGHPDVGSFLSGYWDVYRLCFLSDRPVKGVPFPVYPNRFPEWVEDLPSGRPDIVIARRYRGSHGFVERALQSGGEFIDRGPGFSIISWPRVPEDQSR